MREVLRVVNIVRRRVRLNAFLAHFFDAALVVALALVAGVLFIKLVFFVNGLSALGVTAVGLFAGGLFYAGVRSRVGLFAAAVAADKGLRLSERLSSALLVRKSPHPMAIAVVADARNKASVARPARSFPVSVPGRWWRPTAALAALAMVLCLPQFDMFGRQVAHQKRQQERREVAEIVRRAMARLPEYRKKVGEGDLEALELLDSLQVKLADIDQRGLGKMEALAEISESLDEMAEHMKRVAKDLARKGAKPTENIPGADRQALEKAAEQLAKMQKALESGDFSPQQSQEMQEALEKLAKEMAKTAKAAEEKLQEMQKQLDEGSLSPEEAEKLTKAMQEIAKAAAKQNEIAEALAQMASQMNAGNMSQALEMAQAAMQGMDGMLSGQDAAEQLQNMAEALAGLDELNEALTGEGSVSMEQAIQQLQAMAGSMSSDGAGQGGGMGGPGIGEGNLWEVSDVDTDEQTSRLKGQMRKGRILAGFFTEGGQLKNESKVAYQQLVLESKQEAKGALGSPRIPRAYRTTVRNYFDSLKGQE